MGVIKENFHKEWNIFKKEIIDATKELFSKNGYKQLPNLLSFSRSIAPLIIIPLFLLGNIPGVIITEIIFAITDCFDGLIARKFNLISDLGKKIDTISDKIFAITLLIPITSIIPNIGIVIALEMVIAFINSKSVLKGNNPTSSILGKSKTFLMSISIILAYIKMFTNIPLNLVEFLFAITTITQGAAIVDYYSIDLEKDHKKEIIRKIEEKRENKEKDIKKDKDNKKEKTLSYKNEFPKDENISKTKHLKL